MHFVWYIFFAQSTLTGLEVIFLPEGGIDIFGVTLRKKKQIISVESTPEGIKTPGELVKKIPSGTSLSLTCSGKGVLLRKLPFENQDDHALVRSLLPNAKCEDFYMQKFRCKNEMYVSLIRKTQLDKMVAQFLQAGYYVIQVHIGPLGIAPVLPLLEGKNAVRTTHYTLFIQDKELRAIDQLNNHEASDRIRLANQSLPAKCLLAFAGAFAVLTGEVDAVPPEADPVAASKEAWKQKRIFIITGWSVLVFFFSLLLVNFLAFGFLTSRVQKLSLSLGSRREQLRQIENLKNEVAEKEHFLKRAGWLNASNLSLYADRIAASVPASLTLSEMIISPSLHTAQRGQEEMTPSLFDQHVLLLSGYCRRGTDLNEWINTLQQKSMICRIAIENYSQQHADDKGEFRMKIEVK